VPKRTNDFQQLVSMIQMAFAPAGAKVTESVLVDGTREIDVLIESAIGPYSIKIAVEAKDEKRPLDVLKIELMIGKYLSAGGVPVNKVVVVAQNGFTKTAKARAAQANIELLTLAQASQSDWTKLVPQQMVWRMPPHIDSVKLVPPVAGQDGKDPLAEGRFVCKCHGNDKGAPLQWANWLLITQVLPNAYLASRLEAEAKRRNGQVIVSFSCPMTNYLLAFGGKKHPVDELRVDIHYVSASGPVKWSSFTMSGKNKPDQTVDQMEALLGAHRMRIIFPSGPKSEKIILRMDAVPLDDHGNKPEQHPEKIVLPTLPATCCPLHTPPARPMVQREPQPRPAATKSRSFTPKPKVGRNDLCPCNSGKKYKYCCLPKHRKHG